MISIASPLAGWVTPLEAVPDPVFAERMLGDGIAVDPVEGRVVAPAAGVVSSIHPAGHAVTLELDSGPVLLIHVGLDTVALGGEGFTPKVADGQRVAEGETLIEFDLDLLARRAPSLVTPVIVTNREHFRLVRTAGEGAVEAGQPILTFEPLGSAASPQTKVEASVTRSLQLRLTHGLHARPAARLAKLAGEYDAELELATEDGRTASLRSPVAMLGLGLRHGASLTLRGGGKQAEAAVAALAELLDSGMGELKTIGADPMVAPTAPVESGELRGIVAVPGLAVGEAWRLREQEIAVTEDGTDPATEREAFAAARARVEASLQAEAAGDHKGAEIAAAHLAMLDDPGIDEATRRLITSGKSAAFAWREAIRLFAAPLRALNDDRFAERFDDLMDLERRLLVELTGDAADVPKPPAGAILLAETLYPSQLKAIAEAGIAGIATAAGGPTSHAAIIAAGLGLPMVVCVGPGLLAIDDGVPLIMRGGVVTIADEAALASARQDAARRQTLRQAAQGRAQEPAITTDGARIEVFANLGTVAEAASAVEQGAEGCGLLRTEFLFLDRDAPPDEAEQRQAYQQIADALGERPLIVRTLDIGADKPAPWLPMAAEDNPALGLRGIRLQLARRELLETQLRALLGVQSRGPVKVMLPMVSTLAELRETSSMLTALAREMGVAVPELGIMVETPAAALLSATLAGEAAFFSIGTNDLSQYALARDRTNPAVAAGLDGLDPAVLRLIDETVRGTERRDRITGVCGGLAALPEAIPILIGLGVTELSVPPAAIAETKAAVRSLELSRCRDLAAQAVAKPDAEAVRGLVAPFLEQGS